MTRIMALMNQYKPGEQEKREDAVRRSASPGVEVGFTQLVGSVGGGYTTDFHRSLVAPIVARAAVAAEAAGWDAVVTWGTLDLGVEETRHVVAIPVLGPGRTACMATRALVERFGVVCYDQPWVVMFSKLSRQWRVDESIVGIRSIGLPQQAITTSPDEVFERFLDRARSLLELGAQAILPLGLSMVPVAIEARALADELGVPVPDPLAITMRMAEALAVTGVTNSQLAYPRAAMPPEAPAAT